MKANKLIYFCFLIWASACANKQPDNNKNITAIDTSATIQIIRDSFEAGKIYNNVVCKNDASQSYALYIPHKHKTDVLPVIYFFDPHADGSLPLKKYKALADDFGFILIGSNDSKNGNDWPTTENIWSYLFSDTKSRLNINTNRIYTCGFSGGAKVASYIALHHTEIKAVIVGGAGLPDDASADNFTFSFTGIAGKGDMNMTDLVALNNALDQTSTRHHLILFDGKHEWSPIKIMNIAFTGLQLDAMFDKLIAKNDSLINKYVDSCNKRFNADVKANNLLRAEEECSLSISMLNGLSEAANEFKQKDASINNSTAYKQQFQQQQKLFSIEQSKKAEYQQQFQQLDMQYWAKTISYHQAKSKAKTAEGEMYQRLLAYLSLAFYSVSNQLINNNQNQPAQYFDALYKVVDSTNSEAWYFSAVLNVRGNSVEAAKSDLLKAVSLGFNDSTRMKQQSEFQQYAARLNFSEIESKMKKSKD